MEIKDLTGLSEPLKKLIEVISQGVGALSKPYLIRKTADAKAYEIKVIAESIKANQKSLKQIDYNEEKLSLASIDGESIKAELSLEERTKNRTDFKQQKKQKNIEVITQKAAEQLESESTVSEEPVDEDWTTRFFDYAEDISNEEMQEIWARILAGEIKQPRSYSLRTLELIRNLSKDEANTFMKVAKFAIKSGDSHFLFKGKDGKILNEEYNINYGDTALLTEIGLIQPGAFVNYQILQQPQDSQSVFTTDKIILIAKIKANTPTITMPVDVFSKSGNELLKLVSPNPPFDYLKAIADSIKSDNVEVKYAYIMAWEGNSIRHTQPLLDF
ncbi:DUF2806 domain-containing protein [Prolixibacter denitrificans]|uniref:Putative repeat protein (TIGR03899 family) n=1 Tax=Prolixibacter denitrificans TaxID=1541063 RepID=A0A2P8C6L7_9BACT|nr:DUF2806 domain-containing protein [Prolixibacter denitrificans]PSK80609.1 putative repeat protein (TIGR03899 family) [Prolixibacter denitrificans]GET22097.1 hypothetical protein JCM18694_23430 [Prolixibacter denitrificans]